jgi:hypothetical protein
MRKSKNKPRFFISYSSKDVKIAKIIHQKLEAAGFEVWRDESRLEKVPDWSRDIAESLAYKADAVCLLWSKAAEDSEFVQHEWLTARALEKLIIPCRLPDAPEMPPPLYNVQYIDFEDAQRDTQKIIERLRSIEFFREYDYTVLPENSYIPFNPNRHFTGRHTDLLELYLKMIGNLNKIGINQVGAVGMGGVGKTQLTVEFALRFSFAFDSIYWIQATDTGKWFSQFVELARDRLQLPISDPDKPLADKRYIFALEKYCKKNRQTLIIMDNVMDPEMLNNDSYLFGLTPLTLGCNLLFTTRKHFRLTDVTFQAVDVLSPEGAYTLLTDDRKPNTPEEKENARVICNMVGYLPLAIALASGYLNKYQNVTFADYHKELRKKKLGVIDIGEVSQEELATRHVAAVSITLWESWKQLTDNNARKLFQLAGQFIPISRPIRGGGNYSQSTIGTPGRHSTWEKQTAQPTG